MKLAGVEKGGYSYPCPSRSSDWQWNVTTGSRKFPLTLSASITSIINHVMDDRIIYHWCQIRQCMDHTEPMRCPDLIPADPLQARVGPRHQKCNDMVFNWFFYYDGTRLHQRAINKQQESKLTKGLSKFTVFRRIQRPGTASLLLLPLEGFRSRCQLKERHVNLGGHPSFSTYLRYYSRLDPNHRVDLQRHWWYHKLPILRFDLQPHIPNSQETSIWSHALVHPHLVW